MSFVEEDEMDDERSRAPAILGIALFVAGIVLAVVAALSYVGGILSGPFASALRSYFMGAIVATLLIVAGGLILFFSVK
jgi:fatty acid desaturase